ncbi:MAG TPA: transposase [Terriglobia bacterium]|nr:transposase [Terriglobia bacterium]
MSEEPRKKWDRWPAEFRQRALERMKTCQNVKVLAKELGVARQQLYMWRQQAEGRKKASDPGASEDPRDRRIRELEKKVGDLQGCIGQKTLELDFFAGALRRIEESRQKKGKTGATASTPKSAGGCNRKVD